MYCCVFFYSFLCIKYKTWLSRIWKKKKFILWFKCRNSAVIHVDDDGDINNIVCRRNTIQEPNVQGKTNFNIWKIYLRIFLLFIKYIPTFFVVFNTAPKFFQTTNILAFCNGFYNDGKDMMMRFYSKIDVRNWFL